MDQIHIGKLSKKLVTSVDDVDLTDSERQALHEVVDKGMRHALDNIARSAFVAGAAEGIPTTTASATPHTSFTPELFEQLLKRIEAINTLYDRERGDMPDKTFILKLEDQEIGAMITKIVRRGDKVWMVTKHGDVEFGGLTKGTIYIMQSLQTMPFAQLYGFVKLKPTENASA